MTCNIPYKHENSSKTSFFDFQSILCISTVSKWKQTGFQDSSAVFSIALFLRSLSPLDETHLVAVRGLIH